MKAFRLVQEQLQVTPYPRVNKIKPSIHWARAGSCCSLKRFFGAAVGCVGGERRAILAIVWLDQGERIYRTCSQRVEFS
ncbi:unnamed protein product [Cercopithifilaria johnstoni]|uniref:Uncharacterized protein n=1 Tax=Cercopithifilaria johnstoni TaxID=2874296 RepID=A0A8J2QAG8_9BILA|nr:unnamed protein product [Cercopithifilaria johnstoni]